MYTFTNDFYWPIFLIVALILSIITMKRLAGFKEFYVTPFINVFVFGYTCNMAVLAFQNEQFWENYEPVIGLDKSQFLATIFMINLIFMWGNFKIEKKIPDVYEIKRFFLKISGHTLGVFSLMTYIYSTVLW